MIRLPVYALLIIAGATVSETAPAQDVMLKDAIQCKDFKHNSDGSWYAESVSLNYGPGKKQQMNLFDAKIKQGAAKSGEPDMWALLDEKCRVSH